PRSVALLRAADDADTQLVEQPCVHRRGRVEQRVVPGLRLGEGLHFADVLRARERHAEPVDPGADAAARRSAVLERVEQRAEARRGVLLRDAELREDTLLDRA